VTETERLRLYEENVEFVEGQSGESFLSDCGWWGGVGKEDCGGSVGRDL
jgi:hypothetical protein